MLILLGFFCKSNVSFFKINLVIVRESTVKKHSTIVMKIENLIKFEDKVAYLFCNLTSSVDFLNLKIVQTIKKEKLIIKCIERREHLK